MKILEILHTLILGPIELGLDIIFSMATEILHHPGAAIVVLSLAVNLLALPLYKKADALQQEEREISKRLQPRIRRIKKAFSGDERFMMLQTYYRQNGYKPWYALRGSLSLILQIPFFMAAYNYLSGLQAIAGVSLGPIRDLSRPDGLICIGGTAINLLPILMTAINLVSGTIYTRGMGVKSRIQLFGMAAVFLILLYDSPAGLVFYWTLNNVFSLVKNVVNRLKDPGKVIRGAMSLGGIAMGIFLAFHPRTFETIRGKYGLIIAAAMQIPVVVHAARHSGRFGNRRKAPAEKTGTTRTEKGIFAGSCLLMTLLTGALIPSAVISAAPAEFTETIAFMNPMNYIGHTFLTAAGTFLIWAFVYWAMAPEGKKGAFSAGAAIVAAIALVNSLFFPGAYGDMSSLLQFERGLAIGSGEKLLSLGISAGMAAVIYLIYRFRPGFLRVVCAAGCLAICGMTAGNLIAIGKAMPEIEATARQAQSEEQDIIHLDRKGKNVIVFMSDRAIGALIPYLFEEKPEMKAQFEGFTWFPNTMSYGGHTNVGSPPLFGGYAFLPEKMETGEPLREKQNAALKVMPVAFSEAGWEVTVCDPPYANYQWIPDLSIYSEYPEIRAFNTEETIGMSDGETAETYRRIRNRNFFCYSLFRAAPAAIRGEIYNYGNYNEADRSSGVIQISSGVSTAQGIDAVFMKAYRVLKALPEITEIREEGTNRFLMMSNDTSHNLMMLQEPAYTPELWTDNREYDAEHAIRRGMNGEEMSIGTVEQAKHYQVNMAAMMKIGEWLEWMKREGVYDNTRIILVSDHGYAIGMDGAEIGDLGIEMTQYNPVLMIKDFGSRGEIRTDRTFMTNADTPAMAFEGLIEAELATREEGPQKICEAEWDVERNDTTFRDAKWYLLRGQDIFDINNWSLAE